LGRKRRRFLRPLARALLIRSSDRMDPLDPISGGVMKRWNLDLRVLVLPAIALATVATLVTGAQADRGHRYKDAQRDTRSSYRAPGGFTVRRSTVSGGTSSYRAPGGFTVRRGYVGGGSYRGGYAGGGSYRGGYAGGGSYRGPGGFVVHRQVYAPRAYYGGYSRGPRVRVHFGGGYPSYPTFGTYFIQRPVSGGYLCGPVGGSGLSLNITLGNVLPSGAYYYDPYCHEEFASLSSYYSHCEGRHEARVQVCERDHGSSYNRGYDDDRDDGYYNDDRGQDDGYYDDRRGNDDDDEDDDGGWNKR
jgi:hypothetical protein